MSLRDDCAVLSFLGMMGLSGAYGDIVVHKSVDSYCYSDEELLSIWKMRGVGVITVNNFSVLQYFVDDGFGDENVTGIFSKLGWAVYLHEFDNSPQVCDFVKSVGYEGYDATPILGFRLFRRLLSLGVLRLGVVDEVSFSCRVFKWYRHDIGGLIHLSEYYSYCYYLGLGEGIFSICMHSTSIDAVWESERRFAREFLTNELVQWLLGVLLKDV